MKKITAVILAAAVAIAASMITFFAVSSAYRLGGGKDELPLTEFAKVEQIIEEYYLRDYIMEDVQYAGLKAMVESLGDPYSEYYTPEEFATLNQQFAGEYYGIGMGIGIDDATGLAVVGYFMDGSTAQAAGIMTGDLIISIDGADVTQLTLQEISALCIGADGAAITIGVRRGEEELEFQMVRQSVSMDMVEYELLDDGTGYMSIKQFGGNCEELFNEGMDYFEEQGVSGVIFDLRNNPGGYLGTVVSILDRLLPAGTIVYTEDKNGNRNTDTSGASCVQIPMVLLVNGNTASASEIFAGAIQDYDWGEVVGTRTYGKGVVQDVFPITSTGGGIKITASEYFTPDGRNIDGNGIEPDIIVELDGQGDAQMVKAQETLQTLISGASGEAQK